MIKYRILMMIGFLLVSGCSQKAAAPLKIYTLSMENASPVVHSKYRNKTLKVAYPETLKEAMNNTMNYSYSSSDYGVYQNAQWSNNIGKLLQGSIMQILEQSKLFRVVLPYASTVEENLRLESTVYDFSHHVRANRSFAVVSIQFSLVNTYTGQLIKSKRFTYKENTATVDASGYVKAVNITINKLRKDLIVWLKMNR